MPKCAFCGNQIEKGTGKLFIYVSGKSDYFCSLKCEKNLLVLKRKPLKIRWTEAYRKEHKKDQKDVPKAAAEEKPVEEPKVEEAPKEVKEVTESEDSESSAKPAEPKVEEKPSEKIKEEKSE
jgi:ribosomal protein L24E